MQAPDWLTILFVIAVFMYMPLAAWLQWFPASVADRTRRTRPRFDHWQ